MNSEELEQSLRTEFETYLNDIAISMRKNADEFQKNFEAEFEKHKQQMNEAFRNFSDKLEAAPEFDDVFRQSVIEHLRLARDEGAQLAATAFGEAEKLKEQTTVKADHHLVNNAVKAIKAESSQAAILKVLLQHASNFASRGAFFIVKGDQLTGWKQFGNGSEVDDNVLASIKVPLDSGNLATRAAVSMETTDGAYGMNDADSSFADSLNFGRPDRMYAIPLIARGRGVAVLYVDYGDGTSLDLEALETLVNVAGLTVELLAANQATAGYSAATTRLQPAVDDQFNRTNPDLRVEESSAVYTDSEYTETIVESSNADDTGFDFSSPEPEVSFANGDAAEDAVPNVSYDQFEQVQFEPVETLQEQAHHADIEYGGSVAVEEGASDYSADDYQVAVVDQMQEHSVETAVQTEIESEAVFEPVPVGVTESSAEGYSNSGYDLESSSGYRSAYSESHSSYTNNESQQVATDSFSSSASFADAASPNAAPTERPRYNRGLDLPIEVSEEERKSHTKARRFARLLVSEIKLYNEQKVAEGRQAGDLFNRLREAIERSREMYEKRVESEVAARFDYFDYELVTDLAEGDVQKLGGSYPGSTVGH